MPRCPRCALHRRLCLCALLEPITVETRVVVIAHHTELAKPSNTGRLVPLTLTNGEVRTRGEKGVVLRTDDLLDPERRVLMLYPTDDSKPLRFRDDDGGEAATNGRPVTLIVPDGNWRQARKVETRERGLAQMPRVHLPPGPPSRYRLRSHPNPRFVATFEAVARALGILEGPEVQVRLERILAIMVERTLWSRGLLRAADVTGGIPVADQS